MKGGATLNVSMDSPPFYASICLGLAIVSDPNNTGGISVNGNGNGNNGGGRLNVTGSIYLRSGTLNYGGGPALTVDGNILVGNYAGNGNPGSCDAQGCNFGRGRPAGASTSCTSTRPAGPRSPQPRTTAGHRSCSGGCQLSASASAWSPERMSLTSSGRVRRPGTRRTGCRGGRRTGSACRTCPPAVRPRGDPAARAAGRRRRSPSAALLVGHGDEHAVGTGRETRSSPLAEQRRQQPGHADREPDARVASSPSVASDVVAAAGADRAERS